MGTPVAGRGEAALDDVVGMFVNTLVLRTDVRGDASFAELLAQVRAVDIGAFGHSGVPFERLVEVLNPARSQARHPLFQVVLAFQNHQRASLDLPGLSIGEVELETPVAKFDLQVTLSESVAQEQQSSGLVVEWTYAVDLFDHATIVGFGDRFRRVLDAVVAGPEVVVGDIDLLDAGERYWLLEEWSGESRWVVGDATVVELFDARVAGDRDARAVVDGGVVLSYGELDSRANRFARQLISWGVGPETLVAVMLPRSVDLVVAVLAVLKAGGGYVPVDPSYPESRIEMVLSDSAPAVVVTWSGREVGLPEAALVVDVDVADWSSFDDGPVRDDERWAALRPSSAAYVIYTSGSTGRPKGVVIPHSNVVQLMANTQESFGFDSSDVWTLFHSFAFDFSVWELWGSLLYGGTLVVVDYVTSRSPDQFLELLRGQGVTVLNQTPSAFYQLAEADRVTGSDGVGVAELSLRYVIFGGEALDVRRLSGWFARHGDSSPRLVNMYGITETTVHVTRIEMDARLVAVRPLRWVGRSRVCGCICSMSGCVRSRWVLRASCMSRGIRSRVAICIGRICRLRGSSRIRSVGRAVGSTGPAMWRGGLPMGGWSSWGAPTIR